jgi:hypothetical protein
MYAIVAVDVSVATDTAQLRARLKIGGSYIANSTYKYIGMVATNADTSNTFFATGTNAAYIQVTPNLTNTANYTSAFVAYISTPAGSTIKSMFVNGVASVSGPAVSQIATSGYNSNTDALTGVRFLASSGNISGTFRLYGIKNS